MNKTARIYAVIVLAALSAACTEKPDDTAGKAQEGVYIINNGSWGQNNASVSAYNISSGEVSGSMFLSANGRQPGDLLQDGLRDGDNIWLAVNGSQIVFRTDENLKIKASITASMPEDAAVKLSPRYLVKAEGKIYVSYYEGYVGEINEDASISRIVKVGPNPEGISYAKGKLYVANSGGMNYPNYDNTVSVIDCASFKETTKITVNTNPCKVLASSNGNWIYVSSLGNYADVPGGLEAINTSNNSVSKLDYQDIVDMTLLNERLYILSSPYDANWNRMPAQVYVHNADSNGSEKAATLQDKDGSPLQINNSCSISAIAPDLFFIGTSDYVNTGDAYVFSLGSGQILKNTDVFDTMGLNPIKFI